MPRGARLTVFVVYLLTALAVPVLLALFPGEPPLRVNADLLVVQDDAFVTPEKALGEEAESYQLNVLHDLEDRLAGAAGGYPDGSSALIARFSSEEAAQVAASKLIEMIPHEALMSDLWATRFQSDSGEFVVVTTLDDLLVFIIADTGATAAARLASLPALIYNDEPGFGAVLGQNNPFEWVAWIVGYLLFQLVTISRLASWVAKQSPAKGTVACSVDELHAALRQLSQEGQRYEVMKLPDGDINISWKVSETMRNAFQHSGAKVLVSLHLELDGEAHIVRARLQQAHFDWQVGVGDELLEGGEATLLGLVWENKHYVPLWSDVTAVDNGCTEAYRAAELYAVVAKVVLARGWVFRPVVSFSRFISG